MVLLRGDPNRGVVGDGSSFVENVGNDSVNPEENTGESSVSCLQTAEDRDDSLVSKYSQRPLRIFFEANNRLSLATVPSHSSPVGRIRNTTSE